MTMQQFNFMNPECLEYAIEYVGAYLNNLVEAKANLTKAWGAGYVGTTTAANVRTKRNARVGRPRGTTTQATVGNIGHGVEAKRLDQIISYLRKHETQTFRPADLIRNGFGNRNQVNDAIEAGKKLHTFGKVSHGVYKLLQAQ